MKEKVCNLLSAIAYLVLSAVEIVSHHSIDLVELKLHGKVSCGTNRAREQGRSFVRRVPLCQMDKKLQSIYTSIKIVLRR